jgi:predicted outer membrane protein
MKSYLKITMEGAATLLAASLSICAITAVADDSGAVLEPSTSRDITPQQFVHDASMTGAKEIRLGQVAIEKAQNSEVKKLATDLVNDHKQSQRELMQLCGDKGLKPSTQSSVRSDVQEFENEPLTGRGASRAHMSDTSTYGDVTISAYDEPYRTDWDRLLLDDQFTSGAKGGATRQLVLSMDAKTAEPARTHYSTRNEPPRSARSGVVIGQLPQQDVQNIQRIESLSGTEFDRAYIREMVNDHRKAVALYENARQDVQDPELKMFIDETLPTLREHLRAAEDLSRDLAAMN